MSKEPSGRRRIRDWGWLPHRSKDKHRDHQSQQFNVDSSPLAADNAIASSSNPTVESAASPGPLPAEAKENHLPSQRTHTKDRIATKSEIAEPSLWTLTYRTLKEKDPELVQKFTDCLGITTQEVDDTSSEDSRIGDVAQEAIEVLQEAIAAKEKLNGASAKFRKYFEKSVGVVMACRDYISSAVAANPPVALAWTAVSLLLPLLLNPAKEDEAAIKGINDIVNLMIVYRWREKTYMDVADFKNGTLLLYTEILKYLAALLVQSHQNRAKQVAQKMFLVGNWSDRIATIEQLDSNCRDVTNSIAETRATQWREEEKLWQANLLSRFSEEKDILQKLYSNYEKNKNLNADRIPGTCEWFLSHATFLTWRETQASSLIWLTADPGCGKSVLSKYLVGRKGEVLTVNRELPQVCYFFFKDGDQNRMDASKAVCAFLHQLILQQPHLCRYVKEDFSNKGEKFLDDFDALWNLFLKATENSTSHEIVCVLDALDECRDESREALITTMAQLCSSTRSTKTREPILKFLVTSRPDYHVVRKFKDLTEVFPGVRLHGEDESEQLSHEINLVISRKINRLGSWMDLSQHDQKLLQEKLLSVPHRTYLWLYLTINFIENKQQLTKDDIGVILTQIPQNVGEAYTAILDKSDDPKRARTLLHIVLAAAEPLTVKEINVALVIRETDTSYGDLDFWPESALIDRIKNICGLFLSVVDSRVYHIHQTAREFLVSEKPTAQYSESQAGPQSWKESFTPARSNLVLAEKCIQYIQLRDFENQPEEVLDYMRIDDWLYQSKIKNHWRKYHFLLYAAKHWASHFSAAQNLLGPAMIAKVAFEVCNTQGTSLNTWWGIRGNGFMDPTAPPRNLLVGSTVGIGSVVKLLLERPGVQVNQVDYLDRTPLSKAAQSGHEKIVELLLDRDDVQANSQDKDGRTPLSHAAEEGHEKIVEVLLQRDDIRADLQDNGGQTPLSRAAKEGHEKIVELLLKRDDVQVNLQNGDGQTPLSQAAKEGHEKIVELLLKRDDIQADLQDLLGQTPLWHTAGRGHEKIVELLFKRDDVQVNSQDELGQSPLSWAMYWNREEVVKMILAEYERRGLDVEAARKEAEEVAETWRAELEAMRARRNFLKASDNGT